RDGAKIVAAGDVDVSTDANTQASVRSYADGRGFGGGGYADTSLSINPTSQSLVEIGENAIVIARSAALRATTSRMSLYAEDKGYGAGFWGESDDSSNVTVNALNKVLIDDGASITGYEGVDLQATFAGVDTFAYSFARVTGLFGHLSSSADNTTNLTSNVVADPRTVAADPRAKIKIGRATV